MAAMSSEHNYPYPQHPFLLPIRDVAQILRSDLDKGLSSEQVAEAQLRYEKNELQVGGGTSWQAILSKQFCNAMVMVLFLAMVLSFAIKDYIEGTVLAVVIVVNVTIGFAQELKAEKSMTALRALSSPSAMVLRNGNTEVIPNAEVVPGDVVVLKMGDTVPADLRIFESMNLTCDEQSLTGEAVPVEKHARDEILVPETAKPATQASDVPVGDRVNLAYATTVVRKGRAQGVVVYTGMDTEVGKIAAATTKKPRKPGRSMNYKKYGRRQPVIGLTKRSFDNIGKFLGLTEGTPLQRKLARLAYVLLGVAVVLGVVVFAAHKFDLTPEVVIYAVSLGIAIIPESLVAVLTITMVVAVKVMRDAHVVVRDLSALEALGGVTNICSDKTGTLTQGAMIVRKVWLPLSHQYTVHDAQNPSDPTTGRVTYRETSPEELAGGEQRQSAAMSDQPGRSFAALRFAVTNKKLNRAANANDPRPEAECPATMSEPLGAFLLASSLCNLATVRYDEQDAKWQSTGEPTEIALQVFAHRFGRGKKTLEQMGWSQISEYPFDSSIKRMSVVYDAPPDEIDAARLLQGDRFIFTKGAVERVLDLCTHMGFSDQERDQELTDDLREQVMQQMNSLAAQGQRVLAVAYRPIENTDEVQPQEADYSVQSDMEGDGEGDRAARDGVERDLILLGLAGIYDPPRRETRGSIAEASNAGIKVHMLTGDHPETAKAIAKEVGIVPRDLGALPERVARTAVMRASDLDKMTDAELDELDELPLVVARCAPDTKTRMIEALRRRSALMVMTGDGVNDAPSLSRADVGIAMGSGSDVAKSAAKIVLTDDKFDSIVSAVRQGRRMFDNVQKFILHLLTSNVGEVILLVAGLAFRDVQHRAVFPVSPLEVLWINMVTSSFPAFGLGREPAAADVMRRPPHCRKTGVFTRQVMCDMLVYGCVMGILTMATFTVIVWGKNNDDLGIECNKHFSDGCIPVFRARACVFAELTWMILVSAWEFKDLRCSLFCLNPDASARFQMFRDLWRNKFLFWAVVLGGLSVFPVVYIPYINHKLFKHTAITWEWSLAISFTLLFVLAIEAWKLFKRQTGILQSHAVHRRPFSQGEEGEAGRGFRKSFTANGFRVWASMSRRGFGERGRSQSRSQSDSPSGLELRELGGPSQPASGA